MGKKLIVVLNAVAVLFILSKVSYAGSCGCGGGGGQSSCHGAAQAGECGGKQDSCQDPASMSSGQQKQTAGATSVSKEAVNVGNKICPVLGEKINEQAKVTYAYEGKIYNLCCAGCIDKFKNDPQKYIQKVNEELKAGS